MQFGSNTPIRTLQRPSSRDGTCTYPKNHLSRSGTTATQCHAWFAVFRLLLVPPQPNFSQIDHLSRIEEFAMNEELGRYLHDHLAGATFAIELLEGLREQR